MIFAVLAWLCLCGGEYWMVSADYGPPPPPAANIPELIIKESGPGQQYNWVGYTPHYPKSVPRPLLLYKWQPYRDPTYTAFWVSEKRDGGGSFGGHGKNLGGGSGEIPHGFGAPKPSSIHGHGGGGGGFGASDSYVEATAPLALDTHASVAGDSFEAFETGSSYSEEGGVGSLGTGGHAAIEASQPLAVHFDDSVEASGGAIIHEAPASIYSFPTGGGGAGNAAAGFVEPGQLVHSQQFSDEVEFLRGQQGPAGHVVPLVKPPASAPLPLENESGGVSNSVLESQLYNV